MGITVEEWTLCLEIFQKMTYAQSENEYQNFYKDLEKAYVPSVLDILEVTGMMTTINGLKA